MSMHADIVDCFEEAVRTGKITDKDAVDLCIDVQSSLEWLFNDDEEEEERKRLKRLFKRAALRGEKEL